MNKVNECAELLRDIIDKNYNKQNAEYNEDVETLVSALDVLVDMTEKIKDYSLTWQIKYVDNGFNKQCEPIDISWFDFKDVEVALEQLNILTQANLCINGQETWFVLELHKIENDCIGEDIVLLSQRGME